MPFPRHGVGSYRQVDGVTQRLCGGCGAWKPHDAEHFHRNRWNRTGLQSHCKTCQRAACKPGAARRHARYIARYRMTG